MAVNPYDNCPCGSGKKHKWCCLPYFDRVQQAFDLQQQEQHDGAVRVMQALTAEFPDRPQVWGFYANLLFGEDRIDDAEAAIAKAFELDPHFPMGYLLQGILRQQEGEVIGALLLFRKAAEAYPAEANDQLAQVHEMIARHEVILNRPVAARAALERSVNFAPGDAELRQQFEGIFGSESRLPEAARKAYNFRPTVKPVAAAATGKLSDAKKAFEALTTQVPDDPAAWFNLALCRAWLGEQPAALAALDESLEREWDDSLAEESAALAEVLKCGHGMEGDTDYLEHRVFMPVRDPEAVFQLLQVMSQEGRILAPQMDPNGQFFSCVVSENIPNLLDTGTTMARAVANLTIAGGVVRLWHTDKANVTTVATSIRDRVNLAVGEPTEGTGVAQFQDILQDAMAYPVRTADIQAAESKLKDRATHFFEDVWAKKPLKALSGAAPIDAAGSSKLRKRLLGVVRFLADCFRSAAPRKQTAAGGTEPIDVYDFDRLRHKLGAEVRPAGDAPTINVPAEAAPTPTAAAPAPGGAPPHPSPPRRESAVAGDPTGASSVRGQQDFGAMSAADLAAVDPASLSVAGAEDAMRAALKLEARELAVRFAKAGAALPADAAKPDRYPLFACVVTGATAEGDTKTALEYAARGAAQDVTENGGRRAAEYAVQRARLLARSGDVQGAGDAFAELLEKFPDDPRHYVTATEAMLSAKQGGKAAAFAEKGLAAAKRLNNRDLDGASRELLAAAKRMGG